jgi:hypothetical protein
MYVTSDEYKFPLKKRKCPPQYSRRQKCDIEISILPIQKILIISAKVFDFHEEAGIFKPLHYITTDEIINI